ncbi:DUF1992 domain-containing protein [Leucobacter sp. UCMA 4100]|uniref:DnaJ family domain-containing protein n=1 Tax=Leucobacter sp. UCMA 4100 TaxID=2810534 RepID=UPI0022EB641D|nr:DUF1992 domain-containing protein [Leucobacter sp. UCMA 4100]MDA3145952.1 DUF1992 domain-containing protein [Leucobacter sp. UCMA 4100]
MTEHELPSIFFNPAAFAFDTETMIALIADMQIRKAIERGEFDNLPGAGKPIDVSDSHDPDWWLKRLARREGLVMLPPSVQLRNEDAALDDKLDRLLNEHEVRREIEAFNEHVIWARYQLPAGPPLTTMLRDVEDTVIAWATRKEHRAEQALKAAKDTGDSDRAHTSGRRWLFRKRKPE